MSKSSFPNERLRSTTLKAASQKLEILEDTTAELHTDAKAGAAMDSAVLTMAVTAMPVRL